MCVRPWLKGCLGGELWSGRLLAAPPGNRSCAFRCSVCVCDLCAQCFAMISGSCMVLPVGHIWYWICWVDLCQSACPSVCFAEEERVKCRTFFLLGYNVYFVFMLMLKRLRSVPLMGGLPCPSVSRSPEAAPQERAGRPMGPSTPRCYPQSFLFSSCIWCFGQSFLSWFLVPVCALGKFIRNFEPFKLRPLFALIRYPLLLSPLSFSCRVLCWGCCLFWSVFLRDKA